MNLSSESTTGTALEPAGQSTAGQPTGERIGGRFAVLTSRPALLNALIMIAVLIVGVAHDFHLIEATPFHQDESRWLNRAHYLTDLAHPFGPTWNDQYLTQGQPPIGSYMMGIALLIQGRDTDTNTPWDFRRATQWNKDHGNLPAQGDLLAGRRFNAVVGALAAVVVYIVVRSLTNAAGGIAGALFLIFNPLLTWHNRLALADTTLTLTLALLVWLAVLFTRSPSWWKAIGLGLLIGFGGANKFTPMALAIPLTGIGALMVLQSWRDRRKLRSVHLHMAGLPPLSNPGWMLLSTPITAMVFFVVSYPYLWPDPLGRTLTLIDFRRTEMQSQFRINVRMRAPTPWDSLEATVVALGDTWSTTRHLLASWDLRAIAGAVSLLDLLVAFAGIVLCTWIGLRKGLRSAELIAASLMVFQTLIIILTMRTAFERYFMPIVLMEMIAFGYAIGFGTDVILRRVQRGHGAHA